MFLLAAIMLLGCGAAQPGVTATTAAGTVATFRSSSYHFAIGYDSRLFHAHAQLNYDVPAGSPPELDWSTWPASMGSAQPATSTLPNTVGVTVVDYAAQGESLAELAQEAAVTRKMTIGHYHGTYRILSLGGARGYRAQWSTVDDDLQRYRFILCGLVKGRFDYHITVVCRARDWPRMRGPLLSILDSFRVL